MNPIIKSKNKGKPSDQLVDALLGRLHELWLEVSRIEDTIFDYDFPKLVHDRGRPLQHADMLDLLENMRGQVRTLQCYCSHT